MARAGGSARPCIGRSPRRAVVIALAKAADVRLDSGLGQTFGVSNRDILAAAVAMVDQPATLFRPPLVQSLLKRIEQEGGMRSAADPPADDVSGKHVDDEGDIHEALPGRPIGKIADPKPVGPRCAKFPVDPVERARCRFVADRGAQRPASNTGKTGGKSDFLVAPTRLVRIQAICEHSGQF